MPKVDNFHTGGLKNAPHDVDRRVMTIKQTCCGDESDAVIRLKQRRQCSFGCNSCLTHEHWTDGCGKADYFNFRLRKRQLKLYYQYAFIE